MVVSANPDNTGHTHRQWNERKKEGKDDRDQDNQDDENNRPE